MRLMIFVLNTLKDSICRIEGVEDVSEACEQVSIYKDDLVKVMLVTKDANLAKVLEAMEYVLKGQGYSFKGRLDIVGGEDD